MPTKTCHAKDPIYRCIVIMSIFRFFVISMVIIISIMGIFKVMIIFLTGGNENPPRQGLHPVADGPHCHRVVPTRLKLKSKMRMMLCGDDFEDFHSKVLPTCSVLKKASSTANAELSPLNGSCSSYSI